MSTPVTNETTNYNSGYPETDADYGQPCGAPVNTCNTQDSIEQQEEKKQHFKPAPAKAKDNSKNFEQAPAKARNNSEVSSSNSKFKPAPAKAKDNSEVNSSSKKDEAESTKAKDKDDTTTSSSDQSTPVNQKHDNNTQKTEQNTPKQPDNSTQANPGSSGVDGTDGKNEQSSTSNKPLDQSNTAVKEGSTDTNKVIEEDQKRSILSSEPGLILARFRSGDPELFKLLSDPALGPILMAKIQDAAAAETRMHTLLSNLQKAKDDTLKAIVGNIR